MSLREQDTDLGYERSTSGPGSQALDPSIRQTMAFGNAAWERDDFAAAYQHFHAILQDRPNFAGARLRSGALFSRLGDTDGARREWERCAEQSPDDRRIRAYLAFLES